MTTVLLVDDHALFRKGVRALLETIEDTEVIGEAASGPEAIRLARELRPDLVLLDLQMPGGEGLPAIPHLLADAPDLAILVVTMRADDAAVRDALHAGALGYVLKDMEGDDFIRAVGAVGRGDAFVGREVAGSLRQYTPLPDPTPFPELTNRERAVLACMARGQTNDEISRELFLSRKTVQNNVSLIFSKLQVADRPHAIVLAREAGLHIGH